MLSRCTLLFLLPLLALAQTTLTPADVGAFLDGLIPAQIERDDIAGVVVAIVKDGHVLFARGYGYADVKTKRPVSPDATLFRPGSISKLFTWTAVMQMVEQGKIDLDRDVNAYLDFHVPEGITMRHLMTHTSGFEEALQELFVSQATELRPLREYLTMHLPPRLFAPGTTAAYSNYGVALAGYILQRVSGRPFASYIDEFVLKPLGMTRTTFAQPLPKALEPLMSSGYSVASSPAKPFEFVAAFPAGSSSVTAADMTRFMIAHLKDGEGLLKPETARLMHSRQSGPHPATNHMALGFYEENANGQRIIGHGGDTIWFHSDLHLMLDANVGFFISQNSAGQGSGSLKSLVWRRFLDRYFPYAPPAGPELKTEAQDSAAVTGLYQSSRRGESSITKFFNTLSQNRIYANDDHTISGNAFRKPNGQPRRFREIAPLVFREVDGQALLAFRRGDHGRLEFAIDFPVFVFQRVPWYENQWFSLALSVPGVMVMLLMLLSWPIAAAVRWHYGRTIQRDWKRGALRLTCILFLGFLLAFVLLGARIGDDIGLLTPKLNGQIRAIQALGVLACIGALVSLWCAVRALRTPGLWWFSKLSYTAVALAGLALMWFSIHWNLLTWNLRY